MKTATSFASRAKLARHHRAAGPQWRGTRPRPMPHGTTALPLGISSPAAELV
jgi:hypothetical protein